MKDGLGGYTDSGITHAEGMTHPESQEVLPIPGSGESRGSLSHPSGLPGGGLNIGLARGDHPSCSSLNIFFPLSIWAPQTEQVMARALGHGVEMVETVTKHAMLETWYFVPVTVWWKTFAPSMFNSISRFSSEAQKSWPQFEPLWKPLMAMIETFAEDMSKKSGEIDWDELTRKAQRLLSEGSSRTEPTKT
jgi:hypothetical protein